MRLLPNPWEGLHPAYPKAPPPFSCSSIVDAPIVGGFAGLLGTGLGALVRGRPEIGLTFAAYTAVASALMNGAEDYFEGQIASQYLTQKGIEVPKRRYCERLGNFDYDNIILLGAAAGVAVASLRQRPWAMRGGFSRFGGAACFGAMGGNLSLKVLPWRGYEPATELNARQQMIADTYDNDIEQAMNPELRQGGFGKSRIAQQLGAGGLASQMPMPFPGQNNVELSPDDQAKKLDEEDPRPHLSEMEDGQRIFRPATNYTWPAGADGIEVLRDHIKQLKMKRDRLSQEAELIWYDLANMEAEYYETYNASDKKVPVRNQLQLMGLAHTKIWIRISVLDWMIADSNKNILQMEAMRGHQKRWIPPAPPNKDKIRPTEALRVLAESRALCQAAVDMARQATLDVKQAQSGGGQPMIDELTGEHVHFPPELLEKVARDAKNMEEEVSHKLLAIERLTAVLEEVDKRASE